MASPADLGHRPPMSDLRALTNHHADCRLIKLDPKEPSSPLVIMQEGYSPGDPSCRMSMFYLQRDGVWIDEVARSTRPENEIKDIVFETTAEAMTALSSLSGKPVIREIPVTESDVQAYIARAKSGTPEALFRQFLARYRAINPKR